MCSHVKLTGEAANTVKEAAKTLLLELKQWINEKSYTLNDQIFSFDKNYAYWKSHISNLGFKTANDQLTLKSGANAISGLTMPMYVYIFNRNCFVSLVLSKFHSFEWSPLILFFPWALLFLVFNFAKCRVFQ